VIFGPDLQLKIAQQHLYPYNSKVVDQITAAGSVLNFLKHDKSGAFFILFTVGSRAHEAYLDAERLQT
jgi:hypothetical protein